MVRVTFVGGLSSDPSISKASIQMQNEMLIVQYQVGWRGYSTQSLQFPLM